MGDAVFPFISLQPEATPVAEDLLAAAKAWLQQGPVDRMAFYSAQEGAEPQESQPKAKAKKASPKKRVTTADLAAQIGQLTTLLPQLATQLSVMQEKQEALEKHVRQGAVAAASALPPKPSHRKIEKTKAASEYASSVGVVLWTRSGSKHPAG